jgi:GntR family transcriptional regulator
MEFKINKSSEFPIYQQLKEQIKFYLLSGALQPGTQVPTPKDLGAYLQINRNTVIAAYKELEQEGLLMTKQGQGTYIADKLPPSTYKENQTLLALAHETIERAKELGFTPEDLFTVIFNKTILGLEGGSGISTAENRPRALMVECNQPDLEHYQNTLRTELGIRVDGCLLHNLQTMMNEDNVKNADFIVTHFTHLEDVKAILEPLHKTTFGVMAAPYLQTFMEIKKIPAGAKVGLVCITKSFTENMKKAIGEAGINHITIENCGTDDLEAYNRMLSRVDYVISSRAVIDTVRKRVPAHIKILEYSPELDKAGIQMLKQFVATNFN